MEGQMSESRPILVFASDGKWRVDYGSYTHGEYPTRAAAVLVAIDAAKSERRGLVIEPGVRQPATRTSPLA